MIYETPESMHSMSLQCALIRWYLQFERKYDKNRPKVDKMVDIRSWKII